ncbi:MAG: hypothetical protein K9J77_04870, partial [Rhodoferax sp.]|nr:hypothetical protein [Rhodoferax sp.]
MSPRWTGAERVALSLLCVVFVLRVAFFSVDRSHFIDDDYEHFVNARAIDFLSFVTARVDNIHLAPVHKLLSYLIAQSSPISFPTAVALVSVLHLIAAAVLFATLQTMRPGAYNLHISVFFSLATTLMEQTTWWSSAAHRLPYVIFSLLALLFFLRHLQSGRLRDWAASGGAFLLALGAYSKAVLLPFLLLAVVLARAHAQQQKSDYRALAIKLLPIACVSLTYVLGYVWSADPIASARPAVTTVLEALSLSFVGLAQSFLPPIVTLI